MRKKILTIAAIAVVALAVIGVGVYAVYAGMQPKTYKARFLSYDTGPANIPAARIMPPTHKLGNEAPITLVECRVEGLKSGDMVIVQDSETPDSYSGMSSDTILGKAD